MSDTLDAPCLTSGVRREYELASLFSAACKPRTTCFNTCVSANNSPALSPEARMAVDRLVSLVCFSQARSGCNISFR
jgi:hypothetical protein